MGTLVQVTLDAKAVRFQHETQQNKVVQAMRLAIASVPLATAVTSAPAQQSAVAPVSNRAHGRYFDRAVLDADGAGSPNGCS